MGNDDHANRLRPPQSGSQSGLVDPKLIELLVCPLTKSVLTYDRQNAELISRAARLAYPIRDGVPVMLPDEARVLDDNDPALRRG